MLRKGDVIKEYEVVEEFSSGKNVFLVSKSNKNFVLKVLKNETTNNEIKIGLSLGPKCPFLVEICEIETAFGSGKNMYVFVEYCEEGDLSKRIAKNIPPTDLEIFRFVFEGAKAIQTLHEAGIIHRDIKPGNFFLLKNGAFKLGDYGVACFLDSISSKTMTRVGSDGYISPEILEGEKTYTNKTDIYSFGITLLEFFFCRHPFSNDNGVLNMRRVMNGTPIDMVLKHQHPVVQLALSMIAQDPNARPSAEQIINTPLPLLRPLHDLLKEREFVSAAEREKEREREAQAVQKEIVELRKEKEKEVATIRKEMELIQKQWNDLVSEKDRAIQEANSFLGFFRDRPCFTADRVRGLPRLTESEIATIVRSADTPAKQSILAEFMHNYPNCPPDEYSLNDSWARCGILMKMCTEDYAELLAYVITISHPNFHPDVKNQNKHSPLCRACACDAVNCVRVLVNDPRVDVNYYRPPWVCALSYASSRSNKKVELCTILLTRNDLNVDLPIDVTGTKKVWEVYPELRSMFGH